MNRGSAPPKEKAKLHPSSDAPPSGPPAAAEARTPHHPAAGPKKKPRARTGAGGSEGTEKADAANEGRRASRRRRARGPGRPKGSVSLTKATQERIIAYILNGGTPTVAAKAARVSLRTFREWMSRGEGRHPTRPSTPKLRAFAQAVNEAAAQTTLLALTRAYRDKPLDWLKMAGLSLGEPREDDPQDAPGRSQDVGDPALAKFSDEELHIEIRGFDVDRAEKGAFASPPCPDEDCSCGWHDNWEDETERLAPYEQARSRRRPVGG